MMQVLPKARGAIPSPLPKGEKARMRGPIARFQSLAVALLCLLTTSAFSASTSPLADAAEKSDLAAIRTLLKKQSEVDAPQPDGMTALHWAVYHGDIEAAKILIQHKANVAATNQYGVAP